MFIDIGINIITKHVHHIICLYAHVISCYVYILVAGPRGRAAGT